MYRSLSVGMDHIEYFCTPEEIPDKVSEHKDHDRLCLLDDHTLIDSSGLLSKDREHFVILLRARKSGGFRVIGIGRATFDCEELDVRLLRHLPASWIDIT